MATKQQVIRLLEKQGAVWSEKKFLDEYEFEAYVWDGSDGSEVGYGSFAQTRMSGETMAEFWDSVMTMIDWPVVNPNAEEETLEFLQKSLGRHLHNIFK